jgi:hypothetical protein
MPATDATHMVSILYFRNKEWNEKAPAFLPRKVLADVQRGTTDPADGCFDTIDPTKKGASEFGTP